MLSQLELEILKKIEILLSGFHESRSLREEIPRLFEETHDWSQVSTLVNNFLNQQVIQNENGIAGVAQVLFNQSLGQNFSFPHIEQIVASMLRQGINSWSELFKFFIVDDPDEEFGKLLDERANETDPPELTSSTPIDNETGIVLDSDIVLIFNEAVKAGSGDINIRGENGDEYFIDVTDSSQITFNGDAVTIDPAVDLHPDTAYNIQMAGGVITDLANNAYAGIDDATTLNFETTDTIAPTLKSSNPPDDATEVTINSNLVLTFSEDVKAGTGNIIIRGDNEDTRTIGVTDSSQVTFSGNIVTINPTNDLDSDTAYNIQMDSGVIIDLEGNAYEGINDPTKLNFLVGADTDNNSPLIPSGQMFSYDENRPVGTTIGTVRATDDITVTGFEIVSGNDGGFFAIDATGNISLTANGAASVINDFESLPNNLTLGITASDEAGNISVEQTIVLDVTNIDEPPVILPDQAFSNMEAILDEFENLVGPINEITDIVGNVVAEDDGDVAFFTILSSDFSKYFTIDLDGNLRLTTAGLIAASNDFEVLPNSFVLSLTATDDAGNTSIPEEVLINVTNNPNDDPGQIFDLTAGTDNFVGSTGDDQFLGGPGTLQSSDFIDGGPGIDTGRFVIGEPGIAMPTIQNVEIFDITVSSNSELSSDALDMSHISAPATVNSVESTGGLTLDNVGNIIDLGLDNTFTDLTVNFLDEALASSNDSLLLSFNDTESTVEINTSNIGSIETLNVIAAGTTRDIVLEGSALNSTHTLNISGSANFYLFLNGLNGDVGTSSNAIIDTTTTTGNTDLDLSAITNEVFVLGGSGDNTILAGSATSIIEGGSGDDFIVGGSGNDNLIGGPGVDNMIGNGGGDQFIFAPNDSLGLMPDIITTDADDVIDLPVDAATIFVESLVSSGLTAGDLIADITTAVNNAIASDWFVQEGDTINLLLSGESIAGTDMRYIIQNQNNNSSYDAAEDTVVAIQDSTDSLLRINQEGNLFFDFFAF